MLLTAQELALDGQSLKMTDPRLLNGAQTVKTVKQFGEEENKKRVDNKNKALRSLLCDCWLHSCWFVILKR
jgi:hypothetical protein